MEIIPDGEKTLLDVLNEHNTERKAMVGKTVAPATYWVFEYTDRKSVV